MSVTTFTLWVPGEPKPKERPRLGYRKTYTPDQTRSAEESVQWAWRQAGSPRIEGDAAYSFSVVAFFKRPQTGGRIPGVRMDGDNVLKLALDALARDAKHPDLPLPNDRYAIHKSVRKRFVNEKGTREPGLWITAGVEYL